MTLQLWLTLNAPANCWRSIKSHSPTCRSEILSFIRIMLPNFNPTHTFKAPRRNRNSSFTSLSLAMNMIKLQHLFLMCVPRFKESFCRVLESLVAPADATSKLALAERFTSKHCQKNALPSHLNGNVSQSLQPFSSNTTHLFSPINSFSLSSSSLPSPA